jgi:uncharacterized protein involved in cysteine biosynthesis
MRNRVITLLWITFFAILLTLFSLRSTTLVTEIADWAKSISPIIAWLTAIFIALSGWAYNHYESDDPKKRHWLSNDSNYILIILTIILIALIIYSIYDNQVIQIISPTTTQTTALVVYW